MERVNPNEDIGAGDGITGRSGPSNEGRGRSCDASNDDVLRRSAFQPNGIDQHVKHH